VLTGTSWSFTIPAADFTSGIPYTVQSQAHDNTGGVQVSTIQRVLFAPRIVASAGPNGSGNEGSAISLNGTASGGFGTLNYAWNFGDGSTAAGLLKPSHTYGIYGTYTATLTVTDAIGQTAQSTTTVTVNDVAPTVSIGGPYAA